MEIKSLRSALAAGFVDFPARLVEVTVQTAALLVGQALRTVLPLETFGAITALALLTPVKTIGLSLGCAQIAPRAGSRRRRLQGHTRQ